ncbi:hypothetical protein B296_00009511 [Ensete ventricosum]|uniref:Uncharacterized protein n=1 Tax=Ensete ventricosum TaxID=4639 RepID=A0A426XS41_ENSVE|nr:hypothetical protein B296_00009511 [Ensete ventricosum]
MQWELVGSSLGLYRRYWKNLYEHTERSPEKDCDTHYKECRRLPDYGSEVMSLVVMINYGRKIITIRISQGQVYASGRGSNEAVGNSLGVHRELTEGIGSLLGWHKGVRQKKTETRWKIVGGSRNACWELG